MRRGSPPTAQSPPEFVGLPTLKLIGTTTWDLLCASWVEKLLAPFVGLLLLLVAFIFLPYILIYDFSVLLGRALASEPPPAAGQPTAEIRLDERGAGASFEGPGEGLRCAYCHDQMEGLTHTCGECGTLIHPACGIELGGCPTLGCSKGPAPRKPLRA